MRISACVARWKAFSSCTITATRTFWCCRLQTRSLNCEHYNNSNASHKTKLTALYSPGDYLKPGEDEIDGLKRRLDDRLAPPPDSHQFNASHGIDNEWEIGDCLAQWWRPNFETFMVSDCCQGVQLCSWSRCGYSTLSCLLISRSRRSAKSFSSSTCLKKVRMENIPNNSIYSNFRV